LILVVRSAWTAFALAGFLHAGQTLPVFLSDNHAETFGWITRTFDPDNCYQLVLVDAHSDASMAERSEEIREGLRRVPSEAARADRVEAWRVSGRIQAFNWIEPLMPRPLDQVCWLAAPKLGEKQLSAMKAEAVEHLDGRLEVEPRSAGSFAERWTTVDLAGFSKWQPGARPVILAIDLDFFVGMAPDVRERAFETIWQQAMDWPGLAGVAFAISRPWLADDAEADSLVALACDAVARTRGALLEMDASLDDRPDDSKKAGESPKQVPRWDAEHVSESTRARWLAMRDRLRITDRKRKWNTILDAWSADPTRSFIHPDRGEVDCDGVWRFPYQKTPVLRLEPPADATGRVCWFALEPARAAYDLLPETGLGKSFSVSPGRWIYEKRRGLGTTEDFALAAEKWKPTAAGRVRIAAEVETAAGWLPVPPIELCLSEGNGFRGALSECFHMPYVFGVAGVAERDLSGVDTGWGSDCANFLIHAWRRNGLPLSWGDPGRLRSQLATKVENITLVDSPLISPMEIESGIAIDFGRHMAAVWEDREPLGKLGGNDLVVHHLGGFPEVVTLEKLAKDRPVFSLRVPRESKAECAIKIAGDVVLANDERRVIPDFEKGDAGLFLANLEGVPSMKTPDHAPRYDFRFPPERLTWLKEKGVDAVSLANNHAGDAGRAGLAEALLALHQVGIAVCGAGMNAAEACRPWKTERSGVRVAVFGVCLIDSMAATDHLPGVAKLPEHAALLDREIGSAKAAGETVIVMVHGGDEYHQAVNDEQRQWARWLVNRGANLVAGSHPHVIQRTESYGGAVIAHSLGNAVYPKALKGADSGELRTFRVTGRP
jgi:hypothetical protein